jgi:glycosyltransferase involved in cell wall biosynthesis
MSFVGERAGRLLQILKQRFRHEDDRQSEEGGWVSWDPHPWRHPWLTSENLRRMKAFSQKFLEREKQALNYVDPTNLKVGFCGNMANSLYMRARALRAAGIRCHIYLHPHDQYVMGHPVWEESDLILESEKLTLDELSLKGGDLQSVPDVHQFDVTSHWKPSYEAAGGGWIREIDVFDYEPYLTSYIKTLISLQDMDVLWGASNGVYFAYLANRPYVVSQTGGDIWFEASRNDMLGNLVRSSFAGARVFLASNPWTFAHARRYGFQHVVYLPLTLDETIYVEGSGSSRHEWNTSGGSFYVLSSSRLDERNKGSSIGIEGFALFASNHPGARLVLIGWGAGSKETKALVEKLGIADKVIYLPVSAKARIRDYLRSADVFLDQFVLGYFGSAGLEALACGLPVIGRIEAEQYDAICETGAPPILNAMTPDEVGEHLRLLAGDTQRHQYVRQESRQWFLENHRSQRWLKEYMGVLVSTAVGTPPNFTGTPLLEGQSPAEKIYYAEGLKVAPPFPSYGW